jgi:SAP domain-containing protein
MTQAQFDNGYWYATELKGFAKTIGIPSASRLRKDELEKAIKVFLKAGKIESPTKRSLATSGAKDVEQGLSLSLPVAVYTNDKETKDFLEREAQKLVPGLKRKSGARYRLNRWREEQLVKGVKLSYGDVGQRIRSAEPDQRAFRADPTWEVYQLHERLPRWRERRHEGAGAARLEEAEEA